jgi:hypothetical protein
MTSDSKTQKPAAKAVPEQATAKAAARGAAPALHVDRDEALAIAAGLTEAERDLVAGIVDWQLEGLGPSGDR